MNSLKSQFLLNPDIIYLNHGSFGACPRSVFEVYQDWQRRLEHQPVEFLGRLSNQLMEESRAILADYLGVNSDEVVYFPNPTTAVNMAARSLATDRFALQNGDEILASDHEYGAMDRTWRFICRQTGAKYIQQPIPLPVTTPEDFIERFWEGVTPRTRVIFISHITSPTALIFPIKEICSRAREAGIITIADGAHAPGQIPLHINEIGADIYAGACHKWLCAPKGTAFLYARREIQAWLDPLVVSWGYESDQPGASQFIDYHEWQGTRDLSAFLSVPAAIDFQNQHEWGQVRQNAHALAVLTRQKINDLTGLEPICPDSNEYPWFAQMFSARLPQLDVILLKQQLYDDFQIEVPVIHWNGQDFIRVSIQGYNDADDVDSLVTALSELLPKTGGEK
jgi:isopenicillin-N epimerase